MPKRKTKTIKIKKDAFKDLNFKIDVPKDPKEYDDEIYCKVCGGCGYVDCCGVRDFLEKHVRGKTDCLNEGGFIEDIIMYLEDKSK
jgi:hypothetical protein